MNDQWPTWDYDRGDTIDLDGHGGTVERIVLETHWHSGREDRTDGWVNFPVRAVCIDASGPSVELGQFSISPDQARVLADSLRILADVADPEHLSRPVDPELFRRALNGDQQ
ncbi:hypothetical protein SAMN04515671_0089 [Nakamurella panacisegetis]|uniref:Uncharacterized protein n=1 Tax=Nakamurella panacisegetis TaxID=1090615 RepID=A0A1H0HIR7_9ACTN|nr:hypothetical protein [Nakamurella panacisegetis]SDO19072.1 hypothetical protein SAMN04515671_0089 [Nakamurella panacisegetis]